MPRSRPWLAALSVLALLFGLTAGPLLSDARARTRSSYASGTSSPIPTSPTIADAIYAAFMEQNPNITITREAFQTDQMRDVGQHRDRLRHRPGHHLLRRRSWLRGRAGRRRACSCRSTTTPQQYGWTDEIAAPALEATTIDGALYGMPLQVDLIGMYYNKTLLDQGRADRSDDARRAGHLLRRSAKEKGYIPIAFADNPGWQAFHQFSMTANQMIGPEAMRDCS